MTKLEKFLEEHGNDVYGVCVMCKYAFNGKCANNKIGSLENSCPTFNEVFEQLRNGKDDIPILRKSMTDKIAKDNFISERQAISWVDEWVENNKGKIESFKDGKNVVIKYVIINNDDVEV